MIVFVFCMGVALVFAGAGYGVAGLSLIPTEIGVLYATVGAILLAAGCVVAAIGVLALKVDRLAAGTAGTRALEAAPPSPPEPALPVVEREPEAAPSEEAEDDAPINENRTGHLPSLHAVEEALSHPEPQPKIVGRYSAGGASYKIFADGAIEAETDEGQFKFASMAEFKAYIAERRA